MSLRSRNYEIKRLTLLYFRIFIYILILSMTLNVIISTLYVIVMIYRSMICFSYVAEMDFINTFELGVTVYLTVRTNRFAIRFGLPRLQLPKSGARLQRLSFTRDWEECVCVELDGAGVGWVLPVSHVGMRGNEKLE